MNDRIENPMAIAQTSKQMSVGMAQSEQREIAEVQAMVMMAKRFPRDQIAAMDRVINAFSRPTLAEASQYQYSKGGADVSGPSIRSAEAIAQQWGNIEYGFKEVSRGIGQDGVPFSEVLAFAWDTETITRKPLQFIVRHWRDTKKGGYQIRDEREIYELVANMAQRRVRACLLSIIPGDVTEVAMKQADLTMRAKADTSPEAMEKMVVAFEPFGVTKGQIEKRIQRRIDAIQPAQVVSLKKIYTSLRDGMSVAADWFDDADAGDPGAKTQEKPTYPQDEFDAALNKHSSLIVSGKKTADQIISTMQSKHPLSDDQKAAIKAVKKAEPAASESGITYAQIAEKLNAAQNTDALDESADLIGQIEDAEQRAELGVIYNTRREELGE